MDLDYINDFINFYKKFVGDTDFIKNSSVVTIGKLIKDDDLPGELTNLGVSNVLGKNIPGTIHNNFQTKLDSKINRTIPIETFDSRSNYEVPYSPV